MIHSIVSCAIWLSGSAIDFIIIRAYWKANDSWGKSIDTFLAAITALISGPFGPLFGVILMGPPWDPVKLFPNNNTNKP